MPLTTTCRQMRAALSTLVLAAALSTPAMAGAPELVLQCGHVGEVTSVAYAPDGKSVVTGSRDGTAKVWNAVDGGLLGTLPVSHAAVLALRFADDRSVWAASADGRATEWDTRTDVRLADQPTGATAISGAIGLHGGDVYVVLGQADKTVTVWRLAAGAAAIAQQGTATGSTSPVECVAISPDASLIAGGGDDGVVRTWDVDDCGIDRTMQGHAMPLRALAFSPDGAKLADACDDGVAHIWNVASGKDLGQLEMNNIEGIDSVAWSPDGKQIALGGVGGISNTTESLQLWDVTTEKVVRMMVGHAKPVTAIAFSPDGAAIASGSSDYTGRLWRTSTGKTTAALGASTGVPALAYAANGSLLVSGGADGKVRVWSASTGELERVLAGHMGPVRGLAVVPAPAGASTGSLVVSGSLDGSARVWNLDDGALVRTISCGGPVNAVAVSPDGATLATGCGKSVYDGAVHLFNLRTGAPEGVLDGESLAAVWSVAWSPDGTVIATGSGIMAFGEVRFWDPKTHKILDKEFTKATRSVAFSPNGRLLLAGNGLATDPNDEDKFTGLAVGIYNAHTFALRKTISLTEPDGWTNAVAPTPDSHGLVTADTTGAVQAWSEVSGAATGTYGSHFGAALAVAVSPDGSSFATGGLDNTIRIWDAVSGRVRATLFALGDARGADPLDWLAMTPEGYYDGSPGSSRFIRWQVGPTPFPVDAFDRLLHRPDQVTASLAGQIVTALPDGLAVAEGGAVPPIVAFTTPEDGDTVDSDHVDVNVVVSARGKDAQLYLFADGRPIDGASAAGGKPLEVGAKPLEVGAKPLEIGAKPLEIGAKPLEIGAKPLEVGAKALTVGVVAPAVNVAAGQATASVAFPDGQSSLTLAAVAYDSDGLQGRTSIRVTRTSSTPAMGKLYVLAVGVSQYANPHFNLHYAAADATAFAGLWQAGAAGLYSSVDAVSLVDDKATVPGIQSALFHLIDQANADDTVVLFLSGHGVQLSGGRYYFATHEIDPATEDSLAASALPWTSLEAALAGIRARHVLLFLDACHSGNSLGDKAAHDERMAAILAERSGVIVLASSRGSEYSYEADSLGHGAFTAAIIEGLGQGKADFDIGGKRQDTVTVEGLLAYLRARVPELTDNRQTPTCPLLRDFGDPFPLVKAATN
ncbi:MAG: caspase family protein [Capsulimonadaceae bacterium]